VPPAVGLMGAAVGDGLAAIVDGVDVTVAVAVGDSAATMALVVGVASAWVGLDGSTGRATGVASLPAPRVFTRTV
jgi:hypothetical protein